MSIAGNSNSKVWVSKVENKGTYGILTASSSRKNGDENLYSNWYIRIVGKPFQERFHVLMEKYVEGEHNSSGFMAKKFPITLKKFSMTNEPYTATGGEKVYKNFQMVCWDWGLDDEEESSGEKEGLPADPFGN